MLTAVMSSCKPFQWPNTYLQSHNPGRWICNFKFCLNLYFLTWSWIQYFHCDNFQVILIICSNLLSDRDRMIKDVFMDRFHYWDNHEYSNINYIRKLSSLLMDSHILVSWFSLCCLFQSPWHKLNQTCVNNTDSNLKNGRKKRHFLNNLWLFDFC